MPVHRKIYKSGNSVVISLPGWLLEQHGVGIGDSFVMVSQPGVGIQLTPVSAEEVANNRWMNKGIDRVEKPP